MTRLPFVRALGSMVLLLAGPAAAQPTVAGPSAPPGSTPASISASTPGSRAPAAGPVCFPSCRDGYLCSAGTCISACNPTCPSGLECVEGRRCEPPSPGSAAPRPYEPPPPPLKEFETRNFTLLGFHLGFPGNVNRDGGDLNAESTLGVMFRADSPVAKYVLLGPMLQLGSWRPDVSPPQTHNYYVDLDLVVRLRAPITTSHFNYQVWLGMPVGLTLDIPGSDLGKVNLGYGWNIGVLFGGAMHFTPKFGMFAEVGWEQHRITHSRDPQPDLDFKLQQGLLNLGFVLRN